MKKIIFWSFLILFVGTCLFIEWAVNGLSDLPYIEKKMGEAQELNTDGGEERTYRTIHGYASSASTVFIDVFNEKHKK